jgi:hypothetical protein
LPVPRIDFRIRASPKILGQWENPALDWGEKTGWRLFNAATHGLAGRIARIS